MTVFTSRTDSLVVIKRNVSSFRDVDLAAVYRVYRACMGWKMRVKPYKVGPGVTVCCLGSYDGHERRGRKTKIDENIYILQTVHA